MVHQQLHIQFWHVDGNASSKPAPAAPFNALIYLKDIGARESIRAPAKATIGAATKECAPSRTSARADPTSASTLSGSTASAQSKKLRACATFSGYTLIEPSQTLKIKVHESGVGACSARRASAATS